MQTKLFRCGTLALVSLLLLSACQERSNADIMAAAREHIASLNREAAIIELKSLLQRRPSAGEARFLLGKLMLEAGDLIGAEDQLGLALQNGYPEEDVAPLLAGTLLSLKKTKALVEQFAKVELTDPVANADLKVHLATARIFDGKFDEAERDIERAVTLVPDHADGTALRVRMKAVRGEPEVALRQVDALLERMPKNAAAWAVKADLLMFAKSPQIEQALQAQRTALSIRPNMAQSHAAVMSMLLAQGDRDGAFAQWKALQQVLPYHPQTYLFEAVLALLKGNPARTQQITHQMLLASPNDLRLLLLAAQAEMQLNSLEQAEALLGKALQIAHKATAPRHLLAEVYLRSGRADDVLAILAPMLGPKSGDATALSLAARAQLMSGDVLAADANFARALKLSPEDKRIRTAAAMSQIGRGQSQTAFAELEAIAKQDSGTGTDLALISARLGRREFDAALKAVDSLATKLPTQALPDHLRGRIAMSQGNLDIARRQFELALEKERGFYAAVADLVALDVKEGKLGAARARLEDVRQREPGNAQARIALAALVSRSGGSKADAVKLIDEAIKARPSDPLPHAALIELHLRTGDQKMALEAAKNAVATVPENVDLLDRLGQVNLARSDTGMAMAAYTKMRDLQPKSPLPHMRMAEAHLAAKDYDAAGDSVRRALKLAPKSVEAQSIAIIVAIRKKQPAQALAIAQAVQAQRPNDPVGYKLEGELGLTLRTYDAAAAAFRKALSKSESSFIAKQLHLALIGTRNAVEANRWADSWLAKHPEDIDFIVHLGNVALGQGDLVQTEARFREVLKRRPDDALAMNNIAYAMVKTRKPGALPLAEQAAALAPQNAAVLDTLATVYIEENQLVKALETQIKAVELAPGAGELRLNLAKMLLQANHRDRALAELDKLAALGKAFGGYAEVAQMRKKLGP